MALKRVLDTLDGLEENISALYVERDGKFYLNVDGEGDVDALKRAKDRETQAAKDARDRAAAAEARLAEAEAKLAEANGNPKKKPDDLQRAYDEKLAAEKRGFDEKLTKANKFIEKTLRDAAANQLASEIFTVPALGVKLLQDRLAVDFEGDEPALRVLSVDGTISVASLADLKKEVLANKDYAPIITGSKATGGGAAGAGKGNGSAGPKPYEMSYAERTEWHGRDPAGFAAAMASGAFNPPAKS